MSFLEHQLNLIVYMRLHLFQQAGKKEDGDDAAFIEFKCVNNNHKEFITQHLIIHCQLINNIVDHCVLCGR